MQQGIVIHAPHDLRVQELQTAELQPHQLKVKVKAGGICGSDLHYYHNGGFGTVRIKEPMVLGHEVSGMIAETGSAITDIKAGTRISISPSNPCGLCKYCQEGKQNHCLDMRFYGSAMRMPHVQGAFRQEIIIERAQAHVVADHVSDGEAAMAEPLSVALHAVRRAGPLFGKRVLVTGCGPIGALTVIAARRAGALQIVVTDVAKMPLESALKVGADQAINVAQDAEVLKAFTQDKGTFDVLFEASGNEQALRGALDTLRPGAVIVQVGLGGDINFPANLLVGKELEWRGAFRFHEEFALAVELMNKKLVDVKPLISATYPFEKSVEAFEIAGDRSKMMKVQLSFD
ncbi:MULTISPECIES: L-idonate 5-dehydrogenase [unclassified Herbaspirillum]|uniref:L-idonate 5-dehydrogenase n=1 Tax=unclassified Herbaspirillum TaxID=2624150 RepID=UPI000E2E8400|nr:MULTISPECIES: L-idonate 5-dehydrogenase [unclassified Herbaspirillum]RFB69493.1 L-idonate 5-dehydrogenase [Herbaspirillum sp. 3R-3a1]TFI07453.1 L-idonate 5-dehydrogenase [Herbaspirillum sp. 3R11]TFI12226.1 L-idonate 5-dehydrogenase [Herbaspirillum sp. 3R-11]TFI24431.1 L-idonate 5-dehydrogenase [Herbaspirillum sp. 3C11]